MFFKKILSITFVLYKHNVADNGIIIILTNIFRMLKNASSTINEIHLAGKLTKKHNRGSNKQTISIYASRINFSEVKWGTR